MMLPLDTISKIWFYEPACSFYSVKESAKRKLKHPYLCLSRRDDKDGILFFRDNKTTIFDVFEKQEIGSWLRLFVQPFEENDRLVFGYREKTKTIPWEVCRSISGEETKPHSLMIFRLIKKEKDVLTFRLVVSNGQVVKI